MEKTFSLKDIPRKIFSESSCYTDEYSSLSNNTNVIEMSVKNGAKVLNMINNESSDIMDEVKTMHRQTEKKISKNILMEMYAFDTRHTNSDGYGSFVTCKYTNLDKDIPSLDKPIGVLESIVSTVSKYEAHLTSDALKDYNEELESLKEDCLSGYKSVFEDILKNSSRIAPKDFTESAYLKFRNGENFYTEEYSEETSREYFDTVVNNYMGIAESVDTYNKNMTKCIKLLTEAQNLLKKDIGFKGVEVYDECVDNKHALYKMMLLYLHKFLVYANIVYAIKADAVRGYLNPCGNHGLCDGEYHQNMDPVSTVVDDDGPDFTDDDSEYDGLDQLDDEAFECAMEAYDATNDFESETVTSPELYLIESQVMTILNEEIFNEALKSNIKSQMDPNQTIDDAEVVSEKIDPNNKERVAKEKEEANKPAVVKDQDKNKEKEKPAENTADKKAEKKDKEKKDKDFFTNIWNKIKEFFSKMAQRFNTAAGKYSKDAREYVAEDIYKTYSKSDATMAPNLYPKYEGLYQQSVQRVKDIFKTLPNCAFSNKNIFDAESTDKKYDEAYFLKAMLGGAVNYEGKNNLTEFCTNYFKGMDNPNKGNPVLTNFGPNVDQATFSNMIDLLLSAELTSSQLTKTINKLMEDGDRFTEKYVRNYYATNEETLMINAKEKIASIMEEYFGEGYQAYTEADPAPAAQQTDVNQKNVEEESKVKNIRAACKTYTNVLMAIMAAACTTFEQLCYRNNRILKNLQTGDPIKNSKENRENANDAATVNQNQGQQQQTQQPAEGEKQAQ
ncbi:MAG: hypothetical protein IJ193_00460 [Bacilli bacterium]|nr:hypothetical protein [Bacilli bacterium]